MSDIKENSIENNTVESHIGVLDGIRAMGIFLVCWYHLWQQNWLSPYIPFDNRITRYLGINSIAIDPFVRFGFVFVDLLVFLSAFCNFYPYVRQVILGEGDWPDTKTFFIKRVARIFPSYYLAVIVTFIVELFVHSYDDKAFMIKDLLTHLTFTSSIFPSTFLESHIDAVLWTVEMEVLFYLLIPLLAKLYKKFPEATYIIMMLVSFISINVIVNSDVEVRAFVNHPLTFFCMYANGFLTCALYVTLKKSIKETRYTKLLCTFIAIAFFPLMTGILNGFNGVDLSFYQLKSRVVLSFVFGVFTISLCMSHELLKTVFSNPIVRGFCVISYNLYIWHQWIFAKLKDLRIPYYEGDISPNMNDDVAWSLKYTIIAIPIALIVSVTATFLFERPLNKLILKRYRNNKEKIVKNSSD